MNFELNIIDFKVFHLNKEDERKSLRIACIYFSLFRMTKNYKLILVLVILLSFYDKKLIKSNFF